MRVHIVNICPNMSDNKTKDDDNNNKEIEMSSSNNYKQYILCYNELKGKDKTWDENWVVNENHIHAVAMEDIVEQVEERYACCILYTECASD